MTFLDKPNVQRQLTMYRQLLLNAKSIETSKSFTKQYDHHINVLDQIESAFNNGDKDLLTKLIEQESHYYGWSYLPNDHGEKVETAFWDLKKQTVDKE